MAKHFVRFFFPAIPFADFEDRRLHQKRSLELSEVPKGAYGYCFYDLVEPKNKRSYLSNFSKMTYLGKSYSLDEILELFPEEKDIIKDLEMKNLNEAVKTKSGHWYSLRKGDKAIYEA